LNTWDTWEKGLFYHENELNHSGKSLNYLEKGVNQYGKKVERG
jgi:hypothetical protein